MKKVRTRYAPSPTGYLHIGGARSAIFGYLFAKHYNGDFIIRIEDTDKKRHVEDGEQSQINNLEWLGVVADESPIKPVEKFGPYRQSEKLERYTEIINTLLEEGKAYKAYDTSEELEKQSEEQQANGFFSFRYNRDWLKISDEEKSRRDNNGEFTIRLALPKNKIYKWKDVIRGEVEYNTDEIGDWIIAKQDGIPTYNMANVVDDHDMEISHVFRGEEHIPNTPKQLIVYEFLGWEPPQYGHLTIVTNTEGKKLSKRDNETKQFISQYKEEGYIPEAIFNFLSLLGWSHKDAKEVLSKEELIRDFDEARFSKSPSKFDVSKMIWFSKMYMKKKSPEEVKSVLDFGNHSSEWIDVFVDTYQESGATFSELQGFISEFEGEIDAPVEKTEVGDAIASELKDIDFSIENIKKAINATKEKTGAKGKNLFMPIRKTITGKEHGPTLANAIFLFGKEKVLRRIENYENNSL